MKSKTKILFGILVILLIIVVGVVLAKNISTVQTNTNTNNSEINKNEVNKVVDETTNKIKNEIQNLVEENVIESKEENKIENTINNTNTITKQENNEAQTTESDKEKAINMAKKDWGEDNNVSFKIDEELENGKFVVSVMDKKTTKVVFWYLVDTKNNTIEEK